MNISYNSFVFSDNNYLVSYQSHVEGLGWQDNKNDGEMSGSTGLAKRIEGIKISLGDIKYEGHIEYKSYVENVGFEDEYKKDGQLSGTTGEARRIESVRIKLSGEISDYYDICYRVHVQNVGWLGWAKNDEVAGSNGYGYRLEAIEIKLLSKNDIIDNKKSPYISKLISYRSHIGNFGWQDYKYDGDISGIPFKNQIEGFELLSCNNIGSIDTYYGRDKNNRIYIGDSMDSYVLDNNYNKVSHISSLVKVDKDKLIISNNGKYYSVKIYSLDELLDEAKEYLK